MSRTPAQVSQDIRTNLAQTIPGLSLEIGTPERKIIDAVAEAISEGYLDQYVTGTTLDIDTKSGLELEQFVGIFGYGRLQGRRARGIVRMELSNPATQDMLITANTQFFVPGGGVATGTPLYFYAIQPAVLSKGSYAVDIPVECAVAGSIGNVASGSITSAAGSVGISSVTNLSPMTGGIDVESDDELRQRFKNTFMRNIAGTEDFYRALCLQNQNVSKVAVYGPTTWYRTQVAVPSLGTTVTLPVHQDVKFVWANSQSVFKNLAQPGEVFYTPGSDYNFGSGSSASLTPASTGTMVPGDIVDVEFEYTTRSSRNDPNTAGKTNKVDIFVEGQDPFTISERVVVTSTTFSTTTSNPMWTGNFVRRGTTTPPSSTNRFTRLGSVPIISFPSTLVVKNAVGGTTTTYTQGVHYNIVVGTTLVAGSELEVAGIEWLTANPTNGTAMTVTYSYNRLPELLNALVKRSKQITTDVLVHQAAHRYLRVYLSIEYDRGVSIEQTNANIQTALRSFFTRFGFGEWVEMSDITQAVHNVLGVDNVWVTPSSENATNYGVKVYTAPDASGSPVTNTADFKMSDDQLPVFLEAVITRRANR